MIEENENMTVKMRVIEERNELLGKLIDLHTYLMREDAKQRDLLEKQATIMSEYVDILNERLDAWEE